MTVGMMTESLLDPERCWKLWLELGSLSKVRDQFAIEGLRNPRTLQPPTLSAIQKAAYRWAVENQEESRPDLEYAWKTAGRVLTDDEWDEFLVAKSRLAYYVQPKRIDRFLRDNQLLNV